MIKFLKVNFDLILLIFLMFIASLRAVFKYLPYPFLISILLAIFISGFVFLLFKVEKVKGFINEFAGSKFGKIFIGGVVLILIIVSYVIYPIADARKLIGAGSSADDAIIESVNQLFISGNFYDANLPKDTAISPGPGWIFLNIPFVLAKSYFLLTPFYILLAVFFTQFILKDLRFAIVFLLTLCGTILFWDLTVTGHDLIAISMCFVIIVSGVFKFTSENNKDINLSLIIFSIFTGLISTSRIVFIFLPVLILLLTAKFNFKRSFLIFVISIFTALLFHLYFYLQSEFYQPLHLISRGDRNVGIFIILLGMIITAVTGIFAIKKIELNLESFFKWFFAALFVPLFFISFGEFLSFDKNFAKWEGANYLIPAFPLLIMFLFIKYYGLKKELQNG